MKFSVKKEYVEAYRQISWSDVKEACIFLLKNPGYVALGLILVFFLLVKFLVYPMEDLDSIVEDEL